MKIGRSVLSACFFIVATLQFLSSNILCTKSNQWRNQAVAEYFLYVSDQLQNSEEERDEVTSAPINHAEPSRVERNVNEGNAAACNSSNFLQYESADVDECVSIVEKKKNELKTSAGVSLGLGAMQIAYFAIGILARREPMLPIEHILIILFNWSMFCLSTLNLLAALYWQVHLISMFSIVVSILHILLIIVSICAHFFIHFDEFLENRNEEAPVELIVITSQKQTN